MKSQLTQLFTRARIQASSEMLFTPSLSTDAAQRRLVVGWRNFLSPYWRHVQRSSNPSRQSVTFVCVNAHSMVRAMVGFQGPVFW